QCQDCDATYIGETSRQLKTRISEHERHTRCPPKNAAQFNKLEKDSAIALHSLLENHKVSFDDVKILYRNLPSHTERCCAEALAIHTSKNCVNRNDGKWLSPVWLALINTMRDYKNKTKP
ncbi:MAG: hypothetical protein ACRCTW_07100, partial [Lactococcus garvieae]